MSLRHCGKAEQLEAAHVPLEFPGGGMVGASSRVVPPHRDLSGRIVVVWEGSAQFTKKRTQNQLSSRNIETILAAYRGSAGEQIPVRSVGHGEIKDNDWDLNIGRYLRSARSEVMTVPAALEQLGRAQSALRQAEADLGARLRAAGYA